MKQISSKGDAVKSSEYPEVSTIDYVLWAVNRYLEKGERRFLTAIEHQVRIIYDVYDFESENSKYTIENPLSPEKMSNFK